MKNQPLATYLELELVIKKWLLIKDEGLIKVIAASVLANYLPEEPLWLLIVAPSGGSKTELLRALDVLDDVHFISDLTPQALLSGFKSDEASLLDRIGKFGIIVMKDFTTVLTMNKDKRHEIMARLREVYDGVVSKGFGNGKTAAWTGKIGLIGAVTTVIDQHQNIYQTLGERFIQYRPIMPNSVEVTRRAMQNHGLEKQMRQEIQDAFKSFMDSAEKPEQPIKLPEEYQERIIQLATFCATARSGVMRDGYSGQEITFIPEPEIPTRLAKQFGMMLCALSIISGGFTESDYGLIYKTAFDNLTTIRRRIIQHLFKATSPVSLSEIVTLLRIPANTVRKRLEDLTALEIIDSDAIGASGLAIHYELSEKLRANLVAAMPSDQKLVSDIRKIFFENAGLPEKSEGST